MSRAKNRGTGTRAGTRASPSVRTDPLLADHTIALIGLMGVGKSTVGRRLARRIGLPFFDADSEIEAAAGLSVADIFAAYGEGEFRAGEARVIRRLVEGPPHVLATGGGAVLNPETLALLRERTIMVWLKADLDVVSGRVARRDTRPLLRGRDPLETLRQMAQARYPIYEQAHVTVETGHGTHQEAVEAIIEAVLAHLNDRTDKDRPEKNRPTRP